VEEIEQLLRLGQSLSQRAVKGGFWVFSLRITQQVFSSVRLIILARILAPSDFGLMGIALLMMSTLETFSQTGFQQALIQKKDAESYLNSVWTISIIRGLLLFTILFFIAPYAAIFFKAPQAKPIIRVIGFVLLLQGFTNIGVIYFQKELEFNKQFLYQLSGTLADFVVAVSSVLILGSVWALVFGLMASAVVTMVASYLIHPYRPHLSKDLGGAKELFGFGKWILGSSILVFLATQGDSIFVGKLLGIVALGFYQMAYRISNTPATEIVQVVSQVTFPTYSKLQDNLPKLREAFLKVLQLTSFVSIPLAGGIFILGPDFTRIFLTPKWMPMVPVMQVLVFAGLVRSIGSTPIFSSVGKPKIETKWQMVRLLVLVAFIYPLTVRWEILGTAVAVFLSILVSTIGFNYMAIKITKCGIKEFVKIIAIPLANGIVMVLFILVLKTVVSIGMIGFFLVVGISVFVFFALAYLSDRFINYGMYSLIKECLVSFRGK
jgi:O-antigen/teichoic acid export membrane protein